MVYKVGFSSRRFGTANPSGGGSEVGGQIIPMLNPSTAAAAKKRFCLILVKPSHYDDDGYVIQWFRSTIPSNSLAAVYGLARDCAQAVLA